MICLLPARAVLLPLLYVTHRCSLNQNRQITPRPNRDNCIISRAKNLDLPQIVSTAI